MNININGINVNYIEEGEGDVILMLHGWASNASLFNSQINLLKSKYRVIALNLPGHGGSEEPSYPFCVDDFAKFVIDFLKAKGIFKVTLLGHSVGGRVIIKMLSYTEMPIEVDRVVLVDSAGIKPVRTGKVTMKSRVYKVLRTIFGNKVVKAVFPSGINYIKTKFGSEDYRNATPMMRDTLVKIVNEDLTPILECNEKDTLLIWGRNDTSTPVADGKTMEAKMKKSALVVIEKAGHFPFLEQQFLFNKIIASYFGIEV